MPIHLRPAQITDLPSIYQGEESYICTWEPEHEDSWRSGFGRHLARWVANFDRLTIAVSGDDFAGYVLWSSEGDFAELCTIHVGAEFRRSGVGMALLEAYMAGAAQQGFARLRLSVRPDNPARFMYQKAGFVCTGTGAHGYLVYERQA